VSISLHILRSERARTNAARETERLATLSRLRAALGKLLPGQAVWVFGSVLKPGRFTPTSDIDLALESEPPQGQLLLMSEIASDLDRPVDLLLLSETRLAEKIRGEGERWTL